MLNKFKQFLTKNYKFEVLIFLIFIVLSVVLFPNHKSIEISSFNNESSGGNVEELLKNDTIEFEFKRMFNYIDSVEIQVGNYNNRNNMGTLEIQIYSDSELISEKVIDVNKLNDGEYIKVDVKQFGRDTEHLKIIAKSLDGIAGSSITFFDSANNLHKNMGSSLKKNGHLMDAYLNLRINYDEHTLSSMSLLFIVIVALLLCFFDNDRFQNMIVLSKKHIMVNKNVYIIFIISFGVLILRYSDFIFTPSLYAEDSSYIGNIFTNGLIESMFKTRSGGYFADFQNTGSYVLLYLSLFICKLFNGYDISYLPIFIGLVANAFYALIVSLSYVAMKKISKLASILIPICILLTPVNNSGAEIFGRVLNSVFIWPVLTALVLVSIYNKRNTSCTQNYLCGVLCILSGLSFPLSYGVIGCYVLLTFAQALKDGMLIKWVKANMVMILSLIIGLCLLPSLLQSEGVTTDMIYTASSLIEFSLARHFLYPFIFIFYSQLNDFIVIGLFIIYLMIVIYALFKQMKSKGLFNIYTFIFTSTFVVCIASILMRIKMTQIFNGYQSTFPDRYYYGCNIMSMILLIIALAIIFKNVKLNSVFKSLIPVLLITYFFQNDYLFEFGKPALNVFNSTIKDFTFENMIVRKFDDINVSEVEHEYVNIEQGPFLDGLDGFEAKIPYGYALSTYNASKSRDSR